MRWGVLMSSACFVERLVPLLSHIIYRGAALLCEIHTQCRVCQTEAVARSLQTIVIPGGPCMLGCGTLTPWYAVCDRRALQGTVHSSEIDHASSGSVVLSDDRQILLS